MRLPPICESSASDVSGVIQLSRPISSSSPHGLRETRTPSRSSSAS